ncbi:MAG: GNAT family N-acetyltransferase, partial [Chloroflexi bacterium]|nr:GNAT family N-acetyltransferase [Chloroflexota bacterium]
METKPDTALLRLTPADSDRHRMAIAQITADAFANGQYVEEISQQYIGNSHYDWATTRLIWDGDDLAHHWGVWGYPMRVGDVRLKTAGIGAVVTREPYRKQGLMRRAALASLEAMRENGYDLSVLRGRHYVKYGYARAWNYVTYRLTPDEIPDAGVPPVYAALGPEHVEAIDTLYNRQYASFSGTA